MSPESLPHGGSGLKGDSLHWCGANCHGKGLAGVAKTAPRQGSCRGSPLRPLCSSWSWSWRRFASLELRSYLGSPPLPCLVWWCPWLRLPVHSYRGTRSAPPFCTPTGNESYYVWSPSRTPPPHGAPSLLAGLLLSLLYIWGKGAPHRH